MANLASQVFKRKNTKGSLLFLLGFMIIASFALRVFRLSVQSLWYDEGYSVYLAGKDLASLTFETANDIQPPLYYYLLHLWLLLFGSSEAAVRSLSVLFGVLAVPLFYAVASKLFGQRTGLVAAALAALSPLYLWYSQEARMYTLLVFLTLWSNYWLQLALREQNTALRRKFWAGAALAMVLALYTHYFALFVLCFQAVYVVIVQILRDPRLSVREAGAALGGVMLAYIPWLPFLVRRYGTDASYWTGTLKLDEAARKIGIALSVGESTLEAVGATLALGFMVVWLIAVAVLVLGSRGLANSGVSQKESGRAVLFFVLYLVVPLSLLLAVTYRSPKFNPRYGIIASPPFLVLIAAGLVRLSTVRRAWLTGIAALCALFVTGSMAYADFNAFFDIRFTKPDFRGAIRWVTTHRLPDETILLCSGHAFPVFTYYYGGDDWHPIPASQTLNTADTLTYGVAGELNRVLTGKRGVWLVLWQDEVVDPNGYLTTLLDQYAEPEPVDGSFYHVRLRHYRLPPGFHIPEVPAIAYPMNINYGNKITLLGFSPSMTQTLIFYWEAPQSLQADYKVAVRLKDADGHDWTRAGVDRRLAGLLYPTTRWRPGEIVFSRYEIPAAPGTPPGSYELEAAVYAEGEPQPLDVLDARGAAQGKTARLGQVVLTALQPATLAALGVSGKPIVNWAGQVQLLGVQTDRVEAQAGDRINLTLFWRAGENVSADYELRVAWKQNLGLIATRSFTPAGRGFPTSKWEAGDLIRGQYTLDVPLNIEPGMAEIHIGLFGPEGIPAPFGDWFPLLTMRIQKTDRVFTPPEVAYPLSANLGEVIELIGANLSTQQVKVGGRLQLTLYWKALQQVPASYTAFVHLLDADNRVIAQEDRIPASGKRPTTGWVPGEIIEDRYDLTVQPNAPIGESVLEAGLYNAVEPNWPRLPVMKAGQPLDDRVVVAKVRVVY